MMVVEGEIGYNLNVPYPAQIWGVFGLYGDVKGCRLYRGLLAKLWEGPFPTAFHVKLPLQRR